MTSQVALVQCDSYDAEQVHDAVVKGIGLLGGIARFVKAGETILLKPNVLIGSSPDSCVCTHPAMLRAVGALLKNAGVTVTYGDSPAFGGSQVNLRLSGLKQVADELDIPLADFGKGEYRSHDTALLNKRFYIARGVLEADGMISLPKLKAHGFMRMTGAVKNQFGCIPGLRKGQFHAKMADPHDFAAMLVDINTLLKPRLYIMDAVMAMEGNGPRGGTPRRLGVLLFSADPVALDATACRIIGLNPLYVPTTAPGERAGLGTYREENIELLGDDIASFIAGDFAVVRKPVPPVAAGRIKTFVRNHTCARPVITASLCTSCGTCVEHCPVKPGAVNWVNGDDKKPPAFNYGNCIRCYCCQEMCPEGAISLHEPVLGRFFNL